MTEHSKGFDRGLVGQGFWTATVDPVAGRQRLVAEGARVAQIVAQASPPPAMTAFCRHPGCVRALAAGNVSGVCRPHLHGLHCGCLRCAPPAHGPLSPAAKARVAAARSLSRAEGVAFGLFTPVSPHLKGSP